MKHASVAAVVLLASLAYGQPLLLVAALFGFLIMVTFSASSADAAEYCLSPDGDDSAAGDSDKPWRTIGKANETLLPGDTAVFLPGEYAGVLSPANSGRREAPITYRSSERGKARLVGDGDKDLITLNGRQHITIEGLEVDGRMQGRWMQATYAHHLTIRGCTMRNTPRPISALHCNNVRLLGNRFSQDRSGPSDMMWWEECSELLVEGNAFTRAGHSPFTLNYCNNVVIRANVFHAEWGRNYIVYSLGRALWDGNIITRARDSGGSASSRAHSFWDHGIFHHNRVFDNTSAPLNMGSYIWKGASKTGRFRRPFGTGDSRFYNNTFVENMGSVFRLGGINCSANVFQNNIFCRNDWAGGHEQITREDGISRDNRFIYNLFRGDKPGQAVVRYGNEYWTPEEANNARPTTGGFWSEFHKNMDADPGFIDADNRDYRLGPGSEAIDAGEPIARAVGSGTGRAMPVNDGVPFFDGFGIEGEEGDIIAVGSGDNQAQVVRVELRYHQPAVLHLDREVTWEEEMPVSLPWTGKAPDLGAYQRGVEDPARLVALASPALIEPGESVAFSMDALGKEVHTVTWDFGDGTNSAEVSPSHTYAQSGHYAVTVQATFTNGRCGVDALFIKAEVPLDPSLPLVEADFEDATKDTHWGYQFKFYRGHQTNATPVERSDGQGKCMHIFYDPDKANRTAAQLAPGSWDIDAYPIVRFHYRIPEGVPVAVQLNPYAAPGRPDHFVLAATDNQADRFGDLNGDILADDGGWHEIALDVRRLREVHPELEYLHQFMFSTPWQDPLPSGAKDLALDDCEFWLDDFAILPEGDRG